MRGLHKVYVICRNDGNPRDPHDSCCYAVHGNKGGLPDAIGYDGAAHARKFRSVEDAQKFIRHRMPEWGRNSHCVSEVKPWDILLAGLPMYAALFDLDVPIPDVLLEPTVGRLLVWRR